LDDAFYDVSWTWEHTQTQPSTTSYTHWTAPTDLNTMAPTPRTTRASSKRASAALQEPTPPTTGRLPAKRARPSVDTDETPIKKPRARGKGRGKSRVQEIADSDDVEPEEVVIADSEEERESVIADSEEERERVIADSEEEREVEIADSEEEPEVEEVAGGEEEPEAEEPVKKNKGKGRATAEEVEEQMAEEVARIEEEELVVEELVRVKEEEFEDDLTFDPEGQALGEEEDGEYEEDEEDEGVEEGDELLARLHSLAQPAEVIAGSRRPRRTTIKLSCSVDSFKAVSIGRAGPLPLRSNEVQLLCILEFANRMKHVIRQRHQLAHSLAQVDQFSPFSPGMWFWWTSQTVEEIWLLVHNAVDRSRQIVLGGIFLGHYKFTDIPAPSDEELKLWCVYGDLVNNAEMYVGSATARPRDHGGFSRTSNYERAKRRSNIGVDVSPETSASRHLRVGLQPDAVMELRILAFFDPLKCHAALPLAVEGIFIDFLQSFARDWVYRPSGIHMSPNCKQSSIDASPRQDARWTGLNCAHPFRQGIRRDSLACRLLDEQDWTCEICCKQRSDKKQFRRSDGFPLLQCKNPYICNTCAVVISKAPSDWDLETFSKVRRGDHIDNLRNSTALRNHGMTLDDFDSLLEAQKATCPCCDKKGPTRQECDEKGDPFSKMWHHVRPDWSPHLNRAYWICKSCWYTLERNASKPIQEVISQTRDRGRKAAAIEASLPEGQNAKAAKITADLAERHHDKRQTKLDAARAQKGCCAICQKLLWPEPLSLDGLVVRGPTAAMTLSEKQQEIFRCPALVCNSCLAWAGRSKKFKAWNSTLGDLIDKRRL
jgi:hypothetical protein